MDMVKKVIILVIGVWSLGFGKVQAANNKFGMHVAVPEEGELRQVAELINSNGGDWGYVTVVMQENDLDKQKWQDVFNRMRELRLIPIVRLATQPEDGGFWRRPEKKDVDKWVDFLDSLHWVVKDRYVVLFNEPNHGVEWGGEVDPKNYAKIVDKFSKRLKEKNPDFFVMIAGFDAAAPSQPPNYEDEYQFLRQMHLSVEGGLPALFENLDGWASHSYPNPGFVGSPEASGRNSVMNYQWELEVLKSFGVQKKLPVFIKETGWPHFEGLTTRSGYHSARQVARNFEVYFQRLLSDDRVRAVTPFIFNYQEDVFGNFSWRMPNSDQFYPQYDTLLAIEKTAGRPEQEQKLEITNLPPTKLIHNSTYRFFIDVVNKGQAIWDIDDGYELRLNGAEPNSARAKFDLVDYFFSNLKSLPPFNSQKVALSIKTSDAIENYQLKIVVAKDGQPVSNAIDWPVEVRPNVDLEFNIQPLLWWPAKGDDFKFLIYDSEEQIVYAKENLTVENGQRTINRINNVALDEEYRLVVVKPGSLPRQTHVVFKEPGLNQAEFDFLIPIDFNHDGHFSWQDFVVPFEHLRMKIFD